MRVRFEQPNVADYHISKRTMRTDFSRQISHMQQVVVCWHTAAVYVTAQLIIALFAVNTM